MTDSDEVLVARMASSATMPSSCLKISFLISMDSTTASTTRSASLSSSSEVAKLTRSCSASRSSSLSLPRETARAVECSRCWRPRADPLVVDLHAHDVVAVAGEHLRDPGTHGAQSDNADGLEVTCHAAHRRMRSRVR